MNGMTFGQMAAAVLGISLLQTSKPNMQKLLAFISNSENVITLKLKEVQ